MISCIHLSLQIVWNPLQNWFLLSLNQKLCVCEILITAHSHWWLNIFQHFSSQWKRTLIKTFWPIRWSVRIPQQCGMEMWRVEWSASASLFNSVYAIFLLPTQFPLCYCLQTTRAHTHKHMLSPSLWQHACSLIECEINPALWMIVSPSRLLCLGFFTARG